MQHNTTDEGRTNRRTHLNAHVAVTLLLGLAVILAGCTGFGGDAIAEADNIGNESDSTDSSAGVASGDSADTNRNSADTAGGDSTSAASAGSEGRSGASVGEKNIYSDITVLGFGFSEPATSLSCSG